VSSFFVASGDYTYNNFDENQFTTHNAGAWYNGRYLRYDGDNDESCSLEFTSVGIPSGEYDLAIWSHNLNAGYECRMQVTVTDGSSARSRDFFFDGLTCDKYKRGEIEGSWEHGSSQYYRIFAKSVEIFSGTAHVLIRPDPRTNPNSASVGWIIQEPFGFISASPLDVSDDREIGSYTPTSNKSKPHPLYTN
jgi:hypothetical protein